jgi:hypothetical protein
MIINKDILYGREIFKNLGISSFVPWKSSYSKRYYALRAFRDTVFGGDEVVRRRMQLRRRSSLLGQHALTAFRASSISVRQCRCNIVGPSRGDCISLSAVVGGGDDG